MPTLLVEQEVIDAVWNYLLARLFTPVHKVSSPYERGNDIEMLTPKTLATFIVEAKGQTSSKDTSRKGKEFTQSQKESHLGRALLRVAEIVSRKELAAIALPADKYDRRLVESIREAAGRLGVVVFLVDHEQNVEVSVGQLPH